MTGWLPQEIAVGALCVTVLPLGEISDDLRGWFPAGSLGVTGGKSRLVVNCLHVGGPGVSVLINAFDPRCCPGVGQPGDSMIWHLERTGVCPLRTKLVILTHGHHDHFCGAAGADNGPMFPSVRHILSPRDRRDGTLTPQANYRRYATGQRALSMQPDRKCLFGRHLSFTSFQPS